MAQSTTPATPGVPATMNTVWPPSNPSGTVIPFPLPWGQTGCCPPGGMDALMKCYCDIQQASAFIGQIMLDQINNNPAIIAAIIAGIEKSGSAVPLIGVTNGSLAQPGQVGEIVEMSFQMPFNSGSTTGTATAGILQPGDWDMWVISSPTQLVTNLGFGLSPYPVGQVANVATFLALSTAAGEVFTLMSTLGAGSYSVPTLMAFSFQVGASAAGTLDCQFFARRMR